MRTIDVMARVAVAMVAGSFISFRGGALRKELSRTLRAVSLLATLIAGPQVGDAQPSLVPVSFEAFNNPAVFRKDVWSARERLLTALADNIAFLSSEQGGQAYERAKAFAVDRGHVLASISRFHYLLASAHESESPNAPELLRERLRKEFRLYRSVGTDGRGTVMFTGYFQPVYKASREKGAEYQFPIFSKPTDFEEWETPHPTRVQLEGADGRGGTGTILSGYELAYLRTRYEAYMIHVQGSAILELDDGTNAAVGYAAGTQHPFKGVPKEVLKAHKVAWKDLPIFFARNQWVLDGVLANNNRFIFFRELPSSEPIGSLGVPVRAGTSMATDKVHLPPGALGVIRTAIPRQEESGKLTLAPGTKIVLDQDTGSAIKGPGRVDLFMGTGDEAKKAADLVYSTGELYYLLLKGSEA